MAREMKICDISVIGHVPESWETLRLKDVLRQAAAVRKTLATQYVGLENIVSWSGKATPIALENASQESAQSIQCGAICFAKLRPYLAKAFVAEAPLIGTSELLVARILRDTDPTYLLYWLLSHRFISVINDMVVGTKMPRVDWSIFSGMPVPRPGIDEQQRIAAWLDLQTRRIDKRRELLRKKRELLRDLKKSFIEEATFRGINKSVELRDSGIEWLGQVPSHWQIFRLGSLFWEASDAGIHGLPMLSVSLHSGISDKELDEDEMDRKVSRSEDRTIYKRVKPGDLVYNQMRAWQGAFGTAKIEGLVSPAYIVARPSKAVVPGFVEYLLRAPAAMEEIRRRSRGITDFRLRLYWNEFKNIRMALPPLMEQHDIVAFLDRKLSQIDRQVTLIDQLDDLLKQQRKVLIHEAITGKIDLSTYEPSASPSVV